MTLRGLYDTVIIKSKVHTSDGRGGATTALTTKISSLVCSFQTIRREELRMDLQGQTVSDPCIIIYETIALAPKVIVGDVVIHGTDQFLVITVTETSGIGAHSEAILKQVDGNALIA
jgi:hypothetical protein